MAGRKRITQRVIDERPIDGGRGITLTFHADDGPSAASPIPAVLRLPSANGPVPAALLLHGYASRKEDMAESVGEALVPLGIATLSIDLPLHGDRADPFELRSMRNPFELAARWRVAIEEAQLALRFLAARRDVDRERLGVIGYSLGSYLSLAVAERDHAPRAFVLAAGGDLPDFPLAQLIRSVADPLRGARALAGRCSWFTEAGIEPFSLRKPNVSSPRRTNRRRSGGGMPVITCRTPQSTTRRRGSLARCASGARRREVPY
jgi:uncharacterized protein